MNFIGRIDVTTIEEPDHLQFIAVRQNGLLALILPPTVLTAIFIYACLSQYWLYAMFCVFGAGAIIAYHLNGTVTKLFVSGSELIARGNMGKTFKNEIIVPASEVKYLGYDTGGENNPAGLYVSRGWRHNCMLPGISKNQTIAIADAIHTKFPQYQRQDGSGLVFTLN